MSMVWRKWKKMERDELTNLVKNRINWKSETDYDGFRFDKTHSLQENELDLIDENNKRIIKKFDDLLISNFVCEHLKFWKGMSYIESFKGDILIDFPAWSTLDILVELIVNNPIEKWLEDGEYWDYLAKEEENFIDKNMSNLNNPITRVISKEERYLILKEQKWNCNSCGCKLKFGAHSLWEGEVAHIDHIHPFSKRDSYPRDINERSNLQGLCGKCNLKKGGNRVC